MSNTVAMIIMVAIFAAVILGMVFLFNFIIGETINDLALVEKCQRITGLGFWECFDMSIPELEALEEIEHD